MLIVRMSATHDPAIASGGGGREEVMDGSASKSNETDARIRSLGPWYHSIDLPHGIVTPGHCSPAYISDAADIFFGMGIQDRSVLDVGAWDGAFSFEAERRGAADIPGGR
jgi:hypothetical protein